jgi:hypothetical protein
MVTAILSFLGSVVSALPKLLEFYSKWRKEQAATKDKLAKDTRNEEAIKRALDSGRGAP